MFDDVCFAMINLLFGWLLDRAYGLITLATQIRTLMGIHWAFTGTYLGTVDLTCIAHPCSDTDGCTCQRKNLTYAALAASSIVGRGGHRWSMGRVSHEISVVVVPIWLGQ